MTGKDDEDPTVAAALRGIADIETGRFVTIATDADREALRKEIRAEAARFAASLGRRHFCAPSRHGL